MFDKLNEVSKDLGKIKKNSEAALRRHAPTLPQIERTRDIFDDIVPFEMFFNIEDKNSSVSLDIYFNKPPPARQCNQGCWQAKCEVFDITGSTLVQLSYSYRSHSITAYLNGTQLGAEFDEYDWRQGLVYVSTGDSGTLVVCGTFSTCSYVCESAFDITSSSATATAIDPDVGGQPPTAGAQYPEGPYNDSVSNTGGSAYVNASQIQAYGSFRAIKWAGSHIVLGFSTYPNFVSAYEFSAFFNVIPHCATDFNYGQDWVGKPLIGNAPQSINCTISIGPVRIYVVYEHGHRAGIFPLLGDPEPAHGTIRFENKGGFDADDNGDFFNLTTQSSPTYAIPFNYPIPVSIQVSKFGRYVSVSAGIVGYEFLNPYFGGSAQTPIYGIGVSCNAENRFKFPGDAEFYCLVEGPSFCSNTGFSQVGLSANG